MKTCISVQVFLYMDTILMINDFTKQEKQLFLINVTTNRFTELDL